MDSKFPNPSGFKIFIPVTTSEVFWINGPAYDITKEVVGSNPAPATKIQKHTTTLKADKKKRIIFQSSLVS